MPFAFVCYQIRQCQMLLKQPRPFFSLELVGNPKQLWSFMKILKFNFGLVVIRFQVAVGVLPYRE
jgi:hypothetical protein